MVTVPSRRSWPRWAAEGGPAAVEQAVIGLAALGNMFLELYADRADTSIEAVLWDAAALADDNERPVVLRVVPAGAGAPCNHATPA